MYSGTPFHQQQSAEEADEIIRTHPLATLIVNSPDSAQGIPQVHHIPLLLSKDKGKLIGHIARSNPLSRLIGGDAVTCVAVFHGPEAYISPSWCPSKAEHGRAVPTWNYIKVHVEGSIRLVSDRAWLLEVVTALSNHMEPTVGSSWQVNDAPAAYIDVMLKAITGIEISIASVTGKFKLNQNKASDVSGIVHGLRSRSELYPDTADWMERVNSTT